MPKRRANGEGNIRKRKDGRWEGRYTAGYDANGKAITKNVLGKTQAEVKDKLRAAIEDNKKLDPVKAGSYTLEQWLKLWYSVCVEPQVRYSTKECYHNAIDHHIIPKQGNEHPAGSVDRPISERSERAWDSRADVSGADDGFAARGIAGPTVGGLGCSEPYTFGQ